MQLSVQPSFCRILCDRIRLGFSTHSTLDPESHNVYNVHIYTLARRPFLCWYPVSLSFGVQRVFLWREKDENRLLKKTGSFYVLLVYIQYIYGGFAAYIAIKEQGYATTKTVGDKKIEAEKIESRSSITNAEFSTAMKVNVELLTAAEYEGARRQTLVHFVPV